MLPAMHENGASHVTMVQRSPGYFLKLPGVEPFNAFIRKWFPSSISHRLIRFRVLIQSSMFFYYCRLFPSKQPDSSTETRKKNSRPTSA